MPQEIEYIAYPKFKHVNIFVDSIVYRNKHLHREIELCFVLSGSARFYINDRALYLRQGEGMIINTNDAHSIQAESQQMTGLFFQISTHLLREYVPTLRNEVFESAPLTKYLSPEDYQMVFRSAIEAAGEYFKGEPYYEFQVLAKLGSIFACLLRKLPHSTLTEAEAQRQRLAAARISRIISYVDENLGGRIRLQEIADKENITPTHLSHLFSDEFGMTFQEYVNLRRLEEAVRLMAEGNRNMLSISEAAGFSDQKYMTKMFWKQFGCTPKEFASNPKRFGFLPRGRSPLEHIYFDDEARVILEEYGKSR